MSLPRDAFTRVPRPAAWLLCRKRDGFIRGASYEQLSAESLQIAEMDGDEYRPVYFAPPDWEADIP